MGKLTWCRGRCTEMGFQYTVWGQKRVYIWIFTVEAYEAGRIDCQWLLMSSVQMRSERLSRTCCVCILHSCFDRICAWLPLSLSVQFAHESSLCLLSALDLCPCSCRATSIGSFTPGTCKASHALFYCLISLRRRPGRPHSLLQVIRRKAGIRGEVRWGRAGEALNRAIPSPHFLIPAWESAHASLHFFHPTGGTWISTGVMVAVKENGRLLNALAMLPSPLLSVDSPVGVRTVKCLAPDYLRH